MRLARATPRPAARRLRPGALRAGTAGLALLSLAGCTKPTPVVSLVSGGRTVHTDATSYCSDGQNPAAQPGTPGACSVVAGRTETVLHVKRGQQVGVDVAKQLADSGWFLSVQSPNAQPRRSEVLQEHYLTFVPDFSSGQINLDVRSVADAKSADPKVTGLWRFVLLPR